MKKLFVSLLTLAVLFCFCSCDLVVVAGTSPKADAATLYREGFAKLNMEKSMNVLLSLGAGFATEMEVQLSYVYGEDGKVNAFTDLYMSEGGYSARVINTIVDGWVYAQYESGGEVAKYKSYDESAAEDMLLAYTRQYGPCDAVAQALAGAEIVKQDGLSTFSCELSGEAAESSIESNLLVQLLGGGASMEGMTGSVSVTVDRLGRLVEIVETYTYEGQTMTFVTEFPNPGEPVVITAPADADSYIES